MKKEEEQYLWKKYVKNGFIYEEADFKIKKIKIFLENLKQKLIKQKKSEKDINQKFREEFEKLCQRAECEKPKRRL